MTGAHGRHVETPKEPRHSGERSDNLFHGGQGTPSGEDSSLHIQRNGNREGKPMQGNLEGSVPVSPRAASNKLWKESKRADTGSGGWVLAVLQAKRPVIYPVRDHGLLKLKVLDLSNFGFWRNPAAAWRRSAGEAGRDLDELPGARAPATPAGPV